MDETPKPRRFTILDCMILIAALGVWFFMLRHWGALMGPIIRAGGPGVWRTYAFLVIVGTLALIWVLTPAFLFMRLRRPRPHLRELIWQPGTMACTVAAVLFVPVSLVTAWNWLFPLVFAGAILSCWVLAAVTDRLRPEASWLDRLGRVLGIGWCLTGFLPIILAFL